MNTQKALTTGESSSSPKSTGLYTTSLWKAELLVKLLSLKELPNSSKFMVLAQVLTQVLAQAGVLRVLQDLLPRLPLFLRRREVGLRRESRREDWK